MVDICRFCNGGRHPGADVSERPGHHPQTSRCESGGIPRGDLPGFI